MKHFSILVLTLSICGFMSCSSASPEVTEVLVIGEGTGATTAAIQSARSGAKTTLVLPVSWLGGMLTAAGVSATDGNHQLPAGLWGEFRDSLRNHYGGPDSLFTGWVSNTMFEPSVGNHYWKQIANNEPDLTIYYDTFLDTLYREKGLWTGVFSKGDSSLVLPAHIVVDGTDLGDVAALAGATFDIGMDNRKKTGEVMAPDTANDIIQDLTYAAVLKDYGAGKDKTIPKPADYDARQFDCSCQKKCADPDVTTTVHPCQTMLNYGKLPNGKYMINWPLRGNDYYANIIGKTNEERAVLLEKAKAKTLQFIYYIQTELGYQNLGIADDEFPTADGMPLMPYHREGRRVHGLVQLNVNHILKPYNYSLYRTGIAVGDYPIDHHHYERPDAPDIDFPDVPSFSIPLGALIPQNVDNLIIADKAISVTNIVNGASRLQPVVIQIGQVAGLLAARSALSQTQPKEVSIRDIQQRLLDESAYLMPFIDVKPEHPHFMSIQKVGATGLLRGKGIPYKWANQTWFYPDTIVASSTFYQNLTAFEPDIEWEPEEKEFMTYQSTIHLLFEWMQLKGAEKNVEKAGVAEAVKVLLKKKDPDMNKAISKAELALLIDTLINPFEKVVDWNGDLEK